MKPLLIAAALLPAIMATAGIRISNSAYTWENDTVKQGPFHATATSPYRIVSTYSAQPGYYMGIEKEWNRKNDISAYPQLHTPDLLHEAVYNMALDEMVNAVEPDTTLRTGKEWAGVWTRDVSYSILLSMAWMQPEASKISLMKKVDGLGRIIQDTGSGGAWPVSTDREIWALAAWEIYLVTGDRQWLEYIYPIIKRSLETDRVSLYDTQSGLVRGETSFIDWREQSHPRWMQPADIYDSETLSTSAVHAAAWEVLSNIARILGHKDVADEARNQYLQLKAAIGNELWMDAKGYHAMYRYGRDHKITNPRFDALGESLMILRGLTSEGRALEATKSAPLTPFGVPVFWPYIADMPAYHNKANWPWVDAMWTLANAKAGNGWGVVEGFGALVRPAALFATNKENFNLENGDIATELNSSNMLWSLAGNIALTQRILFGIEFKKDLIEFHPFVPEALAADRELTAFPYRGKTLDISVSGSGSEIKSFTVNGKPHRPALTAAEVARMKSPVKISIVMAGNDVEGPGINMAGNLSAPLTPVAWFEGDELQWNPIEYIDRYVVLRNGEPITETKATSFDPSEPGEYQVIGVSTDGTESFASEPRSNRLTVLKKIEREGLFKDNAPEITFEVPEEGDYSITLLYANGAGPVNTENKCAIRTLVVDGESAGMAVMPQRGKGNWEGLGWSNPLKVHLTEGKHTAKLIFSRENENMNIDTNRANLHGIRAVKL